MTSGEPAGEGGRAEAPSAFGSALTEVWEGRAGGTGAPTGRAEVVYYRLYYTAHARVPGLRSAARLT